MKASKFGLLAAAFVANVSGVAQAQSYDTAQQSVRQSQDDQHQRHDHHSGYHLSRGQSWSGQDFDNASRRNDNQWSYPQQRPEGYQQFQNFNPYDIRVDDRATGRYSQCVIGGNVQYTGNFAALTVCDQYTNRPLLTVNGAHNLARFYDYGYQGRGVRYIDVSLDGVNVTGASVDGTPVGAEFGAAFLSRNLAGRLAGTSLDPARPSESKPIANWIFDPE